MAFPRPFPIANSIIRSGSLKRRSNAGFCLAAVQGKACGAYLDRSVELRVHEAGLRSSGAVREEGINKLWSFWILRRQCVMSVDQCASEAAFHSCVITAHAQAEGVFLPCVPGKVKSDPVNGL